jgi:hypothetical protein
MAPYLSNVRKAVSAYIEEFNTNTGQATDEEREEEFQRISRAVSLAKIVRTVLTTER